MLVIAKQQEEKDEKGELISKIENSIREALNYLVELEEKIEQSSK